MSFTLSDTGGLMSNGTNRRKTSQSQNVANVVSLEKFTIYIISDSKLIYLFIYAVSIDIHFFFKHFFFFKLDLKMQYCFTSSRIW